MTNGMDCTYYAFVTWYTIDHVIFKVELNDVFSVFCNSYNLDTCASISRGSFPFVFIIISVVFAFARPCCKY